MKTRLSVFVLLLFVFAIARGQTDNFTVTGSIKSADGKPFKKLYIFVLNKKGTVATNDKGEFQLDNLSNADTLLMAIPKVGNLKVACVASPIHITVNKSNVNVQGSAESDLIKLVPKERGTGMGTYLSREDIITSRARSLSDLLRGRVAGVVVRSAGGVPGGESSTTIRGASSITLSSEPLVVLDGLEQQSMSQVSNSTPIDIIGSVEILKDGAMFGAKGANGVIIVTTIRGKQ